MSDFLKDTIKEVFKSKKQQRYPLSKVRGKINIKKKSEVDKTEDELDEIVDDLGNIARSKIPTDYRTKGTTSKEANDANSIMTDKLIIALKLRINIIISNIPTSIIINRFYLVWIKC
jgi:hypothetical protein